VTPRQTRTDSDEAATKKLLRFGTDRPQCAVCRSTDWRALCNMRAKGKVKSTVVCRSCLAKRRSPVASASGRKAKALKAAGYDKPACVVCNDPTLRIIDLDHLSGAANSTLVEPLCASHHAIKSFMAESGPMAALRLRDPARSALALQAAFELGLGAILGMFAVWDGMHEETARCIFLGAGSAALFAWAAWNLTADAHFEGLLGPGYDRAISAQVPR
jgi:hypothetical protein